MNTINPRRNDIYLGVVPFADSEGSTKRPVIIISSNHYNENQPDVVVCCITTNSTHECYFNIHESDLEYGKLDPESGPRTDMIVRLNKNNLKFKIGKIKEECHKKLLDKIVELIK